MRDKTNSMNGETTLRTGTFICTAESQRRSRFTTPDQSEAPEWARSAKLRWIMTVGTTPCCDGPRSAIHPLACQMLVGQKSHTSNCISRYSVYVQKCIMFDVPSQTRIINWCLCLYNETFDVNGNINKCDWKRKKKDTCKVQPYTDIPTRFI